MMMPDDRMSVRAQFPVHYKTARINALDIFYREAGPPDAPALLLLHGFPTSSNMFRNLVPRLATSFHVIAPDFPGFGQSSMPERGRFAYTFENLANVVDALVGQLGLSRFSLYVMDYGAPVGYRVALRRPEQVQALIVQNGNAYEEGLPSSGTRSRSTGRIPGPRIERRFMSSWSRSQPGGSTRMA
jgi:pimeloyl-ACP methyl ester carboxylesterase